MMYTILYSLLLCLTTDICGCRYGMCMRMYVRSWSAVWQADPKQWHNSLVDCQGSMLQLGNDKLLFSGPYYAGPKCVKHPSPNVRRHCPQTRVNMTISRSNNAGRDWQPILQIANGSSGYSCLADLTSGSVLPAGSRPAVGLLYELKSCAIEYVRISL